ncbi:MAG TPA: hypothetical protein VIX17_08425, partial [Pyrinomonadaceae bacterium]
NDATSYPSYAQVTVTNQSNYTWAGSTSDTRALQKAASSDRLAATWYSTGFFDIDINLTDGLTHQVAIYCVDWDSTTRSQRVDVFDAVSNALLDTRNVSGFSNGQYLLWNISGHVKLRVTNTSGANAVVSGLFFQPMSNALGNRSQNGSFLSKLTTEILRLARYSFPSLVYNWSV